MTVNQERKMYSQILVPLDGSKTAEKALPYARTLASKFKLPVELLTVIDITELATRLSPEKARHLIALMEKNIGNSEQYLKKMAGTFQGGSVKCTVDKGTVADVIIQSAAADKGTLINMATHGRSGIERWLLGSIAKRFYAARPTRCY
jgi:nucleotide-binding universal stress UspA family protein